MTVSRATAIYALGIVATFVSVIVASGTFWPLVVGVAAIVLDVVAFLLATRRLND